MELIEIIRNAVQNSLSTFNETDPGSNKHAHVVAFQNKMRGELQNLNKDENNYDWRIEEKTKINVNDSVDIFGEEKNKGKNVIIEIDGWRADQVAKKFLSRVVLYSLNGSKTDNPKPIDYIAVLYPQNSSSLNESIKYIMYANVLIKTLHKESRCSAIIFNGEQVLVYEPNSKNNNIRYKVGTDEYENMAKTAEECVKKYYDLYKPTPDDLREKFKPYIKDNSNSRAIKIIMTDKEEFYISSQWRSFGSQSNWEDFVKLLPKELKPTKLYHIFEGEEDSWKELSEITNKKK